jgi:nicotinate-nucleotide adenylyltransferase
MPTGNAPHKEIEQDPGAGVRLEMATLVAAGDELLEVSDLEVTDPGPSYTFRTLEKLSEQRPREQIYFLMGADVAANLGSWKQPERVLELARLGIAARPGAATEEAEAALERLGADDRAEWVRMPELGVSSTRVRRRVGQGRPIRYLVTDPVLELIEANDLYRQAARV